jgi:hypothetical protein
MLLIRRLAPVPDFERFQSFLHLIPAFQLDRIKILVTNRTNSSGTILIAMQCCPCMTTILLSGNAA